MKRLQLIVIIVLSAALVFLYVDDRRRIESLTSRIVFLEEGIKKVSDECETRIALLKAEETPRTPERTKRGGKPLVDLMEKLPVNPREVKKNAFDEVSEGLKLDRGQEKSMAEALEEFEKAKGKVFEKAGEERRFVFEPRYVGMIDAARSKTLENIKTFLSEEQYAALISKGYDEKLGLRISRQSGPGKPKE